MSAEPQFITIAKITRRQGRNGELAAELHTDFPERFAVRRRVFALFPDGTRGEFQLENHWVHKGRVILKFRGVDTIDAAQPLVGTEIQVVRQERPLLAGAEAYVGDLVGCLVFDGASEVGRIEDVQFGAGDAPLLVVNAAGREVLLPFAFEYLKRLDVAGRRVEMCLPEGMLSLDAPLTDEEKREQRG